MTRKPMIKRAAALLTVVALGLLGVVAAPASPASAAPVTFDLWAKAGSTTLPGSVVVPVWGYKDSAAGTVTAPGGPVLEVSEGDVVTINLTNELGEATSLLLQGQELAPDLTGAASGGNASYTFTASHAGTYLYEAGLLPNAQHQTAMGLHGALVVHPATAGQAYADPLTAYNDEAVLVLSEIDPVLNNTADPATFDMRKFNPRYTLVNGHAHPDVAPIATSAGNTVLLRYVNAGIGYHSMGVLGAGQSVIALDGSPLDFARHYTAETIGPGQTADALVLAPNLPQTSHSLSVYDASLLLHNSNTGGPGGMYTTIDVTGTPAGTDTTGPVTSGVAYDAGLGTLSATVDDSNRGNNIVQAAEFYVDDVTVAGSVMGGAFSTPTEAVSATVSLGAGDHIVYVRGQDDQGYWGPFSSVLVTGADTGGPTTLAPLLTPRLTNHDAAKPGVAVTATGDDSSSGNSNVTAAEYFIDTAVVDGAGVAMTVSDPAAPISSLAGTIPRAVVDVLGEGTHVIWIHSQDAQGNWGVAISVNLDVDLTGPATSGTLVEPSPNNGTRPFNSSVAAVRVSVPTMSDPVAGSVNSTIAKAEMFIDTIGATGSGVPLTASDGLFNDASEGGYVDIPLSTVKAMSNGTHTIYVHARDAAGNWGAFDSNTLLVDKVLPVLSSVSITPNPTQGASVVTFTGTATDAATPVVAAEWYIGADPGLGKGKPLAVTGTGPWTINDTVTNWNEGTYTIRVRVRDQAGNWSLPIATVLTVTGPLFYSTFGNTNPPTVGGTADDADIYNWNGTAHSRAIDFSAAPYNLPGNANVDGYDRVDATHFYLSFSAANTTVPGLGSVQDEDVVYYNAGAWSIWFDGTVHGLTTDAADIDAISVSGSTLYFSTLGNANPPTLTGGDDADIYSWNGSTYARVWDATDNGLAGAANVDGVVFVDATHLYLSFSPATTTVPVVGAVQDEDVVYDNSGTWSVYFDGTAHGLGTAANLDLDAFDLP